MDEDKIYLPVCILDDEYVCSKANFYSDMSAKSATSVVYRFLEAKGEEIDISVPVSNLASLPFKPGRHIELQHGDDIYRCVLSDGKLAMKFINKLIEKNVHY